MADVPAWVLVLNTAAAGGFGLLGTYLVPRGQREARQHEARRTDAAIMRDKAEAIFEEISRLEQEIMQNMLRAMQSATIGSKTDASAPKLTNYDRLRALVAVYYPRLLITLDEIAKKDRDILTTVEANIKAAADSGSVSKMNQTLSAANMMAAVGKLQNFTDTAPKLRAQMIEEVRQYLPGASQQGAAAARLKGERSPRA